VEATPEDGWEFVNWTAPAGSFDDADDPDTTFTMPAQDVTVTANFEDITNPSATAVATITPGVKAFITTDRQGSATEHEGDITFTSRSIGTNGNITVTLEQSGGGEAVTVFDEPTDNEVNVFHADEARDWHVRDAVNAQSDLVSCSFTGDQGDWASNLPRTYNLSGGDNIVLEITWDEDVDFTGSAADFELNGVEAIDVSVNADTITVTWNVPLDDYATDALDPLADGNTLEIAAGAVESDATGGLSEETTWQLNGTWAEQ